MFSKGFVHNRPHGCWFTAHPCYGTVGTHPTGTLSRLLYLFPLIFFVTLTFHFNLFEQFLEHLAIVYTSVVVQNANIRLWTVSDCKDLLIRTVFSPFLNRTLNGLIGLWTHSVRFSDRHHWHNAKQNWAFKQSNNTRAKQRQVWTDLYDNKELQFLFYHVLYFPTSVKISIKNEIGSSCMWNLVLLWMFHLKIHRIFNIRVQVGHG